MKKYKNFNEIRGKVWKTIEKILRKFKKKLISFKCLLKLKKKLSHIWENFLLILGIFKILKKFYVNLGKLQDF